jgi:DNA mismatch endonuclease (patch repair protein)
MIMADVFTPEQRIDVMRKVKSQQNKSTEGKLILFFKTNKIIGWRRHYPIKGKPDIVFLKQKVAIFADGCFWHGHDCRNTKPKQNEDYWQKKQTRNIQRDKDVTAYLIQKGWEVIRIWECDLKNGKYENQLKSILCSALS